MQRLTITVPKDLSLVEHLAERAKELYTGTRREARSSSVAIAETFGRPAAPYQALARGGLTNEAECGAIAAGRVIISEFFCSADPTASLPEGLVPAMHRYHEECTRRIQSRGAPDFTCGSLIARYDGFDHPDRIRFCASIVKEVAKLIAEILTTHGCIVDEDSP